MLWSLLLQIHYLARPCNQNTQASCVGAVTVEFMREKCFLVLDALRKDADGRPSAIPQYPCTFVATQPQVSAANLLSGNCEFVQKHRFVFDHFDPATKKARTKTSVRRLTTSIYFEQVSAFEVFMLTRKWFQYFACPYALVCGAHKTLVFRIVFVSIYQLHLNRWLDNPWQEIWHQRRRRETTERHAFHRQILLWSGHRGSWRQRTAGWNVQRENWQHNSASI